MMTPPITETVSQIDDANRSTGWVEPSKLAAGALMMSPATICF